MLLQAKVLPGSNEVASKSIFYVNRYLQTTNTTTYTFTACDIGTASDDRRVIVGAHMYGGTSRSLTSSTIAGISATELTTDSASTAATVLIIAAVPSGTTGDIVLTWSGSCAGSGITVWYATGLTSDTPVATARVPSTSAPSSGSLSTVDGGFVVAAATCRYNDGTTRTHSWTNATEQHDSEIENTGTDGGSFSGAHAATTGASVTVTDTFSTTAGTGIGAFATF